MNRGSLHTESFRRIHFSVFSYRWTINGLTGPKSFLGFRKQEVGSAYSPEIFVSKQSKLLPHFLWKLLPLPLIYRSHLYFELLKFTWMKFLLNNILHLIPWNRFLILFARRVPACFRAVYVRFYVSICQLITFHFQFRQRKKGHWRERKSQTMW